MANDITFDAAEVDLLMELIAERLEAIDVADGDPSFRHPKVDQLETVLLKLHQAKEVVESDEVVVES